MHTPAARVEARVEARLLDNKWHTIEFLYQLGTLSLIIDRESTTIANATYNSILLTDQEIKNEAAVLILGTTYSGCLLSGPGLIFNTKSMNAVSFGPCPIMTGPCTGQDVLVSRDYCLHDPCMQHGICVSKTDGYDLI